MWRCRDSCFFEDPKCKAAGCAEDDGHHKQTGLKKEKGEGKQYLLCPR